MSSHRVHSRPARGVCAQVKIDQSPETISGFLEDAAHYPGGHTHGLTRPRSEAEIATIIKSTQRLLPIGAQSSLTGGATPMGELLLITDRLDGILHIDKNQVKVQAGVPLSILKDTLASHDAFFPSIPTFEGAFAGGIVATNAAGAATFKYGSTRDWVRSLTVVLADGSVLDIERGQFQAHPDGYFEIITNHRTFRVPVPTYRMPNVPKHSAGYFAEPGMDLIDLFIGSEGTLGVVTEITFGIVSPLPARYLVWLTLPSETSAVELVALLREETQATWQLKNPQGIDVAAIEQMDRRSLDLICEDGFDRQHSIKIQDDATVVLLIQIEIPIDIVPTPTEAYSQIDGALITGGPDTPLVRLCQLLSKVELLDRAEIVLPQDQHRHNQLLAVREAIPEAVNRRVSQVKREGNLAIEKTAADVIVPFTHFLESLKLFRRAFEQRGLDYAIWGHISDGNIHPNVVPRSVEDVRAGMEAILECGHKIIQLGGCPLAEHGVGRNKIKQALLKQLYGKSGIKEMRNVKTAFDPESKLAPGVLFQELSKTTS